MIQKTLTGDGLQIELPECDYYKGCKSDATHVARLLKNYERMVDVPVCESCRDEILEYKDDEYVRRMTVRDRFAENEVQTD